MIEAYRFGRIEIDGQAIESDLIIVDGAVKSGWWRRTGHELCLADLKDVLPAEPRVLVVGTGAYGRLRVLDEVVQACAERGIKLYVLETADAVERLNRLAETPGLAGALHLTC